MTQAAPPKLGKHTSIDGLTPSTDRDRVDLVRMPPVDVSSTEIRQRIARGQTIAPYVPPAISAYIDEKGLYQD